MKIGKFFASGILVAVFGFALFAQKPKPAPAAKAAKPIIFAVLHDGTTLEPIAYVNSGKLEPAVNGSDDKSLIREFSNSYYRVGSIYKLIFGGADGGTVSVKSSNVKAECAPNTAEARSKAVKTPLKGFIMGLATNLSPKVSTSFRRKPTAAEKSEMDALVKKEFLKHKLTPTALRYQNLTAIDVNNDGKPEFVGSYWTDIDKLTRGLLFFIAEKGSDGKYSVGYSEYRSVDQASVMSGQIKDIDDGTLHELLLDSLDYNGDGTNEIFTYTQSFEGAGFNAYKKSAGKWTKDFENANYHCGY